MRPEEKAIALTYCRELLARHRPILALYANPRIPRHVQTLEHLQLNLEMRELTSTLSATEFHIEPVANIANITTAIRLYRPKVFTLSAHGMNDRVLLETSNGKPVQVDHGTVTRALQDAFEGQAPPELFMLMMCRSARFGEEIARAFGRPVIAWGSVVEDKAARSFLRGCIQSLGTMLERRGDQAIDVAAVFDAGKREFEENGYAVGDPVSQLHPGPPNHFPGQPNALLSGCIGCYPTVHGLPMLLASSTSDYADLT